MNSVSVESLSRSLRWLSKLIAMPAFICTTPSTMLIFILTELRNWSSVRAPCQAGSTPAPYVRGRSEGLPEPPFVTRARPCEKAAGQSARSNRMREGLVSVGSVGQAHLPAPKRLIGIEKNSL